MELGDNLTAAWNVNDSLSLVLLKPDGGDLTCFSAAFLPASACPLPRLVRLIRTLVCVLHLGMVLQAGQVQQGGEKRDLPFEHRK